MKVVPINFYRTPEVLSPKDKYSRTLQVDKNTIYCYAGRGSIFGNYHSKKEDPRTKQISDFKHNYDRESVINKLDSFNKEGITTVYVGCSCLPKECHTEEVAYDYNNTFVSRSD